MLLQAYFQKASLVPAFLLGAWLAATGCVMAEEGAPEKEQPATTPQADTLYKVSVDRNMAEFLSYYDIIRKFHADPRAIHDDKLAYAALDGMLRSLDPYSRYIPPEGNGDLQNQDDELQVGIGLNLANHGYIINEVLENTSAAKNGLRGGDRLATIDGVDILSLTREEIFMRLQGDVGTVVELGVQRGNPEKTLQIPVERENFTVANIDGKVLDRDIGYIRIRSFDQQASAGFHKALETIEKMTAGKTAGFIIDLRSNGGGLLDEAVTIADDLLEEGDIVTVRKGTNTTCHKAHEGDRLKGKNITVLIDDYSASGAEVLAGALQDNGRATIIGTKSFGKGSAQQNIKLPNGGVMRMTVAHYVRPSGRSVEGQGIIPDVIATPANGDFKNVISSQEDALDPQIQRALLHLRGTGLAIKPPVPAGP